MKTANVSIFLDKRWESKTKEYPVKLRIYFQGKTKFYQISNYYVTEKDFEKINGDKPREEVKRIKGEINKVKIEAEDIIAKLPYFTFELFEKQFLHGQKKSDTNIFNWLENAVNRLKAQERIKTSHCYNNSLRSLKKYTQKSELSFYDISVDFLNLYEIWFTGEHGKSLTTLGIYLRNVRTLFNEAIEQGVIMKDAYPFGRRKYEIPSGQNIKKALTLSEIQKIYYHPVMENSAEDRWKSMWIFSYLCNGANTKDICLLKRKNVTDGRITFLRAKTRRTKRQQAKPIMVILTAEIETIIKKWGNTNEEPESYLFPILSHEMDATKIAAAIDQTTWMINKYIKRIAEAEKITKKVTTYTARHSFATVLKRSGVSTEFISESIGHSDLITTENYLDSFEDDMKKEFAKKLLDFGNQI
jgi:integrase/recombinase XerD